MDKLRVGFIGAGRISDLHAIEYLRNPRAQLLAVCDIDPEIARRQSTRWGVPARRVFANYHDLLTCEEIDLVEILLPHHLHAPVVLAAIRAGKHVSVQKPMRCRCARPTKSLQRQARRSCNCAYSRTCSSILRCSVRRL